MSGGVDSSVAALRLIQDGYQVEGLFMKNWEEDDDEEYCAAKVDLADAEEISNQLGIRLHSVNFSSEYWDRVFEHFLHEYRAGRTPNPDILCNKEIKFKAFLDYAIHLGADKIATGHYARVKQIDGRYRLLTGLDKNKDQSYFLYALNQHQLGHSLFPLGDMEKSSVRSIAEETSFANARKKDSTGICFIGERKFSDFLSRYIPASPGEIVTLEQEVIGEHNGLMFYTYGQRHGLGIGGLKNADEEPWFVVDKDLDNNRLIVAQGHDHPALLHEYLQCSDLTWTTGTAPYTGKPYTAKIRYRQTAQACRLAFVDSDNLQLTFTQKQRAITPGQAVVIYDEDICLGGGVIDTFSTKNTGQI